MYTCTSTTAGSEKGSAQGSSPPLPSLSGHVHTGATAEGGIDGFGRYSFGAAFQLTLPFKVRTPRRDWVCVYSTINQTKKERKTKRRATPLFYAALVLPYCGFCDARIKKRQENPNQKQTKKNVNELVPLWVTAFVYLTPIRWTSFPSTPFIDQLPFFVPHPLLHAHFASFE